MQVSQIPLILPQLFLDKKIEQPTQLSWQIDPESLNLLVLLSEDNSWLRLLIAIAPLSEAQPYLPQILEANFDETQQVRYALHESVLWGVFQHNFFNLTQEDFEEAIMRLILLKEKGLSFVSFNGLIEEKLIQIVRAAKLQGQSLEMTYKTIKRFYQEGVLGGMEQNLQEREQFLTAWKYQLERLWNE